MNATKKKVLEILLPAFRHNRSIVYIAGAADSRILALLSYCYDCCDEFGKIYLDEKSGAAALLLLPHQKSNSVKAILRDFKFVIKILSWGRIKRVIKREKDLKKLYPEKAFYHLWYVGVLPAMQQNGSGTRLLNQIIKEAQSNQLPVYLETSEQRNFKWYELNGFVLQHTFTIGGDDGYILQAYKKPV
ncbi:MAG: hypothetical protein RLZZ316_433 [Bacteroidota bacterium]|jgi:ribosomal protein S18 acetylase RimI-like enzyme